MKNARIGEKSCNNYGTEMKIIEYTNNKYVLVEFQDKYKYKTYTSYRNFTSGNVKNPYDRTVCGIGYIGEGKYSKGDYRNIYDVWYSMISRCYNSQSLCKNPSYSGCVVDEEFHNFQKFAEWYEENYYEVEGEHIDMDKDILSKHNKRYSKDTILLVPRRINSLFISNKNLRGDCPIGVSYDKNKHKFISTCNIIDDTGKRKKLYLGLYDSKFNAFLAYKKFKEKYIKNIADEYRDKIPDKVYNAMYNYVIEYED